MQSQTDSESLFELEPLILPAEFIGEKTHAAGGNLDAGREWTQNEIEWMLEKKAKGYNRDQLAAAMGRSVVSVQLKLKRLHKKKDSYNKENRKLKYSINQQFLEQIKPKSILDVYAGNSYWLGKAKTVRTNDKDTKFNCDYSMDALKFLCQEYLQDNRYDLVDLDPYGSAYEGYDLAIKLAKKAIIVSFGEWGHKRWKRIDFVEPRYGIQSIDDFADGQLFIQEFQRQARCNKKSAKPKHIIQYENFLRVYFILEDLQITSQWDKD